MTKATPHLGEPSLDELKAQFEQFAEAQRRDFVRPRVPARILIERLNIPRSNLDNWNARDVFDLDADRHREERKARLYSTRDCIVLSAANQLSGLGMPLGMAKTVGIHVADHIMRGMATARANAFRGGTSMMIFRDESGDWQLLHYTPGQDSGLHYHSGRDRWEPMAGIRQALERPPAVRIDMDVEKFARDVVEAALVDATLIVGNVDELRSASGRKSKVRA